MSTDLIRYDLLAQEALRGVVRRVLEDTARTGVPGEHHFYISFNTEFPGVRMSPRLREKYPEEMTIIIQHQFWDLAVSEHGFEIGLSFSNVPEKLYLPFDSITGFFDPSVKFGLKFEPVNVPVSDDNLEPLTPRHRDADRRALVPAAKTPEPTSADKTMDSAEPVEENAESGAQIVSLDKFRKK